MEMCGKETFINKTLTDKHLIRLTGSCQRNVHEFKRPAQFDSPILEENYLLLKLGENQHRNGSLVLLSKTVNFF